MKALPDELARRDAVNAEFAREVAELGLRYRCEHCAHVRPTDLVCSLGYPNAMLTGPVEAIAEDGHITFCKYFELGEQTPGTARGQPGG